MLHLVRDIAGMIPPEEVHTWVIGAQAIIFQNVILSTLVTYDASKSHVIEVSLSCFSCPSLHIWQRIQILLGMQRLRYIKLRGFLTSMADYQSVNNECRFLSNTCWEFRSLEMEPDDYMILAGRIDTEGFLERCFLSSVHLHCFTVNGKLSAAPGYTPNPSLSTCDDSVLFLELL